MKLLPPQAKSWLDRYTGTNTDDDKDQDWKNLLTGYTMRMLIFITLLVSAINLNDGETNAIEGMTHFVLFATFIMLSLLGL